MASPSKGVLRRDLGGRAMNRQTTKKFRVASPLLVLYGSVCVCVCVQKQMDISYSLSTGLIATSSTHSFGTITGCPVQAEVRLPICVHHLK